MRARRLPMLAVVGALVVVRVFVLVLVLVDHARDTARGRRVTRREGIFHRLFHQLLALVCVRMLLFLPFFHSALLFQAWLTTRKRTACLRRVVSVANQYSSQYGR